MLRATRSLVLTACVLLSASINAADTHAYLVAHVSDKSPADMFDRVATLNLSNCLHVAEQTLDVIVIRVHCNDPNDLRDALLEDVYPLIAPALKAQWINPVD